MGVMDMAKKSDEGKGNFGAETSKAKRISTLPSKGKGESLAKSYRNPRTGMLVVGKYRRRSPHMTVTKH